jgi:uncharacterized protein YjbI with pentapeptide repeats
MMKATHDDRENWRDEKPDAKAWYDKLNETEIGVAKLAFVAAIVFVIYIAANSDVFGVTRLIDDFAANFIMAIFSVVVTVFLIDRSNDKRAEERQKNELILQMGSPDNGFAIEAVRKLRHYGWLEDGSLQQWRFGEADLQNANLENADLKGTRLFRVNLQGGKLASANLQDAYLAQANLQGVNLENANLQFAQMWAADLRGSNLRKANLQAARLWDVDFQRAILENANLQGADLSFAKMQNAMLRLANLQGVHLYHAKLQGANLWKTDLQAADLENADLQNADLVKANLKGANLRDANLREVRNFNAIVFDTNTTLPNGDQWKENYELAIFIIPQHPNFWEPKWVKEGREQGNNDAQQE